MRVFNNSAALLAWAFEVTAVGVYSRSSFTCLPHGNKQWSAHDIHAQAAIVIHRVNQLHMAPRLTLWASFCGGDEYAQPLAEYVSQYVPHAPSDAVLALVRNWMGGEHRQSLRQIAHTVGWSHTTVAHWRRILFSQLNQLRQIGLDELAQQSSDLLYT